MFEWLGDRIHSRISPSVEVVYVADQAMTPPELARARRLLAQQVRPLAVTIRGDQLVVEAPTPDEAAHAFVEFSREPIRLYVVVYQSPELDRIKSVLRRDDQAKKLGLTIALDPIGYHLEAPSDLMYVNPAWAANHHCTGHHIEGTGTGCLVTARERIDAYVRGDPDLFVDEHHDLLTAPPGRAFYGQDDGRFYELESLPIVVERREVVAVHASDESLVLRLPPARADALAARLTSPDTELVAELAPGTLSAATVSGKTKLSIAMPPARASQLAGELILGGLGLHAIR